MILEEVYIALIINKNSYTNLSSFDLVINLFNETYPMNTLVFEKYLVDGSTVETNKALDEFINKYPSGKRATISTSTSILVECSNYFKKNNINILSLSLSALSNLLQQQSLNVLTYSYFNQYAIMNNFMIYCDYNMKQIHVLYELDTTNDVFYKDTLETIKYQANILNIQVIVSFFKKDRYNYNIKEKSMVIILANTDSLTNIYITPKFIKNFPKKSIIILNLFNRNMTNIFEDIPAFVPLPTNINFTPLSETIYNAVKNNPDGFDFTVYPFYDIIFVLNDFATNNLEITKENYTSINPYKSSSPAWILNTSLSPLINGSPYGKFQFTFTKDVIIAKNKSLFLKYYGGGQQQLPDSYSILKISGITPNNPSLIEYDEAEYYKIYNNENKLLCVKNNCDVTNFPFDDNLNIGITSDIKFIYEYTENGYFLTLDRLYSCTMKVPKVNLTMSKIPIKLKYIISHKKQKKKCTNNPISKIYLF
jgi:hypothetical protein